MRLSSLFLVVSFRSSYTLTIPLLPRFRLLRSSPLLSLPWEPPCFFPKSLRTLHVLFPPPCLAEKHNNNNPLPSHLSILFTHRRYNTRVRVWWTLFFVSLSLSLSVVFSFLSFFRTSFLPKSGEEEVRFPCACKLVRFVSFRSGFDLSCFFIRARGGG